MPEVVPDHPVAVEGAARVCHSEGEESVGSMGQLVVFRARALPFPEEPCVFDLQAHPDVSQEDTQVPTDPLKDQGELSPAESFGEHIATDFIIVHTG